MRALGAAAMALAPGLGGLRQRGHERRGSAPRGNASRRELAAGRHAREDARPPRRARADRGSQPGGTRAAGTSGVRRVRPLRPRPAAPAPGYRPQVSPLFPLVLLRGARRTGRRQIAPVQRELPARGAPVLAPDAGRRPPCARGRERRRLLAGRLRHRSRPYRARRPWRLLLQLKARNAATAGAAAALISNYEPGSVDATLVEPGIGIPVSPHRARPPDARRRDGRTRDPRAHGPHEHPERDRERAPSPARPTLMPAPTSTRSRPAPESTTTPPASRPSSSSRRPCSGRASAPRSLRLLGRRGVGPSRLTRLLRVPPNQRAVVGYLNFDMLGAPTRAGRSTATPLGTSSPALTSGGRRAARSDRHRRALGSRALRAAGIPVAGLFSGGYPCYHQRCDRIPNVNMRALGELADAAAHAVAMLEPR